MDSFTISFKTGNDAFADDKPYEICRILRTISAKVDAGETSGEVMDVNGNKIGQWSMD